MAKKVNPSFMKAAAKSIFNSSAWDEDEDSKVMLTDYLPAAMPKYHPTSATVVGVWFGDNLALRIRLDDGKGHTEDFPLSTTSALEEDDEVDLSTMYGVEVNKPGAETIVRWDGEVKK